MLQDFEERWEEPKQRAQLLDAIRWIEGEPSLLGAAQHLLAVAAKNRRI
jgi:hypothetical protein